MMQIQQIEHLPATREEIRKETMKDKELRETILAVHDGKPYLKA